jgi:hypothetical protein
VAEALTLFGEKVATIKDIENETSMNFQGAFVLVLISR